jgi:hypothetical protein
MLTWTAPPRGADQARPIVLFWGDGGLDTRTTCANLFAATQGAAFVLCQKPHPGPSTPLAASELKGALQRLKKRFGAHVAPGPVVFVAVGHVVPASIAVVREEPSFFSRVVLVADGQVAWSPSLASLFARSGGNRVLFACATEACLKKTTPPVRWLERQGALGKAIRTTSPVTAKSLQRIIEQNWAWLIEGDPRFRSTEER